MSTNLTENAKKVLELIKTMGLVELNDLVKTIEEESGVSAAAPMMAGAALPAAEAVDEQTEFDVILAEAGATKIDVIKVVREINQSLGLTDAKALVESAPKTLLEGAKKEVAMEAKKKLEAAGAKVELK